jgi:hypothetical protein
MIEAGSVGATFTIVDGARPLYRGGWVRVPATVPDGVAGLRKQRPFRRSRGYRVKSPQGAGPAKRMCRQSLSDISVL